MKPSAGIGLGRPVKRMLKRSDPVPADSRQGGPSRNRTGTHQPETSHSRANEAAALPSPQVVLSCGSTSTTTASDSLPATAHFPAPHRLQDSASRAFPQGASFRGGPLQFPPPPSERSAPSYAGESLAAASQDLHRFHGLRREPLGAAPSSVSNDAAGFACAADRSVAPPQRAFDAGLRPGPFPGQAASLLPGSLAITRTGLPPAGDDELPIRS
jgi:hypothetical protein